MTRLVFNPTGFLFNSRSMPIPRLKKAAIISLKMVSYVIEFPTIVSIIISPFQNPACAEKINVSK